MVIVSHLNAHTEIGMEWLDDIVVPGLRKGSPKCDWEIEVHGNEEEPVDEESGETASEGPGPAVYIIHKKPPQPNGSFTEDDPPAISLKFLSY
jgi:hypothetical protein